MDKQAKQIRSDYDRQTDYSFVQTGVETRVRDQTRQTDRRVQTRQTETQNCSISKYFKIVFFIIIIINYYHTLVNPLSRKIHAEMLGSWSAKVLVAHYMQLGNPYHRARLLATRSPHGGHWLHEDGPSYSIRA